MIQEAYVSFELAKNLKGKGFDWPCNYERSILQLRDFKNLKGKGI